MPPSIKTETVSVLEHCALSSDQTNLGENIMNRVWQFTGLRKIDNSAQFAFCFVEVSTARLQRPHWSPN